MQIPCGHDLVLLWRRCATLCTSAFMDDVTFGRNGPDGEMWRLHHEATTMSGVASLMSMNLVFSYFNFFSFFSCLQVFNLVSETNVTR